MTVAAKQPKRTERARAHHGKTIRLRRLTVVKEPPTHYPIGASRPRTRGECVDGPRPCAWASCKYHLLLDSLPPNSAGDPGLAFSTDLEVWEMRDTCALDVADEADVTLERVGLALTITRERVRQLVDQTIARLPEDIRAELERAGEP